MFMKVAVYNQMFGLNGKSLFGCVLGHYYVHGQKNPEKVLLRAKLSKTIRLVRKTKADIIGICEIYQGQENYLIKKLRQLGYIYIYLFR